MALVRRDQSWHRVPPSAGSGQVRRERGCDRGVGLRLEDGAGWGRGYGEGRVERAEELVRTGNRGRSGRRAHARTDAAGGG